jgi:hypothetical protein
MYGIKESSNFDGFVKSRKTVFLVIPAKAGIQYIEAPCSKLRGMHSLCIFKELQNSWTPVFTGVTTFYEVINFELGV